MKKERLPLFASSFILSLLLLLARDRYVFAQDDSTDSQPALIDEPYQPLQAAANADLPSIDWQGLENRYAGEHFVIQTDVGFYTPGLQLNPQIGPVQTCEDSYKQPEPNIDTLRACASVGITADTVFTDSVKQETAIFTAAAQRQIDALNRAFADSQVPIRAQLATVTIGQNLDTCANQQHLCIVFKDMDKSNYLGYVQHVPDPQLGTGDFFYNQPGNNPAFIVYEAQAGLQGCYPSVNPALDRICNGVDEIGDGVVAHEVTHVLGLKHTFNEVQDCSVDGDGIPDTPVEWGAFFKFSCDEGQTTKLVDICPLQPGPNNVDNMMSYYYLCDSSGRYCSLNGKHYTHQQILKILFTLEKFYPELFRKSRVSEVRKFAAGITAERQLTMTLELKAGTDFQIQGLFKQDSTESHPQEFFLKLPQSGNVQESPLATTTAVTFTVPLTDVKSAQLILFTNPITQGTHTTYGSSVRLNVLATRGFIGEPDAELQISAPKLSADEFAETPTTPPPATVCTATGYTENIFLPFTEKQSETH